MNIDLDALGIEELVGLRDTITEKLKQKVAARQTELESELKKLSQYGTPTTKKTAPPKKKKDDTQSLSSAA